MYFCGCKCKGLLVYVQNNYQHPLFYTMKHLKVKTKTLEQSHHFVALSLRNVKSEFNKGSEFKKGALYTAH